MPETIISPVCGVALHVHHEVFFGEAAQRGDDLVFVALGLGLDGERHERRRVLDGREGGRAVGGERVAGHDVFELGDGADVAGDELVGGLRLFALLFEQRAEALLVAVAGDREVAVAATVPWKTRKMLMRPLKGSATVLKTKAAAGLSGSAGELDLGAVGGERRDRPRRRRRGRPAEQVEQQLDAEQARGRTHGHREDAGVAHGLGEAVLQLGLGDLLFHQELLGELVAGFGDDLGERVAQLLGAVGEVGRHLGHDDVLAVERVGLHAEEVDHAREVVLGADRQLHGDDLVPERLAQAGEAAVEVGALAVEHVAEQDARAAGVGGAAPEALGLDLDAHHRVDDDERGLDDAQRADGVGLKAGVAGGVDEVEREAVVLDVRQRRGQAELTALFVVVPVAHRAAVFDLAQAVDRTGAKQERLEEGRLAGAAVADEGDVPDLARLVHADLLGSFACGPGRTTQTRATDGVARGDVRA